MIKIRRVWKPGWSQKWKDSQRQVFKEDEKMKQMCGDEIELGIVKL